MSETSEQGGTANRRALIAVVGDARIESGAAKGVLAEQIGRALIDHRYRLLTGGLGGVMEAACRGARASARHADGDTVAILPGHDPQDANPFADIVIASGLDHVRNSVVAHADAIIAIGGGAGTLSELCFGWMYKRLIICLRVDGWSGKLADSRLDERIRYPTMSDDRLFGADSPAEAVRLLNERLPHYRAQHRGITRRTDNDEAP